MKKLLLLIGTALLTLAACNKEIQETTEVVNQNDVVLTFSSTRPELEKETGTKTAWDNSTSSVIWSATDKIRVAYTLDGEWMGKDAATGDNSAKFYASDAVNIDGDNSSIGTFNVPVGDSSFTDPETSGNYVFYALYPSTAASATIDDVEALAVNVPSEQTPEANSFQGSADILVGKTNPLTITGIPTDPIEIDWTRLVAHADLTFSNIAFDGEETINTITLTANDAAKLTGGITIDLAAGIASAGSSNVITINGTNLSANGSSVEAWVCVLPVTFTSLNVVIQTNKAKYTREITGISKTFKNNARNKLTINMSTANRIEVTPDEYTEYTSAIVEGDYVVYYNGNALKAAVASDRMENEAVTPNGDVIATNNPSIIWHIAPSVTDGYYTFYNAETGQYLAATNSKNQAQLLNSGTDDRCLFSVEITNGKYNFINKARAASASEPNNKYLRNNGTSGWAMYSNSIGNLLTLYYKDTRTEFAAPASVSAAVNGSDDTIIDVTFATVDGAASYTIIATPESGDPVSKAGVSTSPATISVADGLAYDTEYTISVVAVPSNTTIYKNSAATSATGTVTTGSAPVGYVLVTSTDKVTTGQYILAAKVNGKYYAMSNTFASKIKGTEITSGSFVTESAGEDYAITITKEASTYSITSGTKTLGYSSSTNFTIDGTGTTVWTLSAGKNGTFRFTVANGSRVIAYNTSQFGAYASSNVTDGSTSYYDIELFKFNGVIKSDPETTVTPASPIALTVDGTQQLTVVTDSNGAITYVSDNDDVATVSNAGLITAIAAGTAHITVSIAATATYKADEKVITVNVSSGAGGTGATITDITSVTWSSTNTGGSITGTIGNYTITISDGYIDTTNKLIRVYSGNTISIAATTGTISGITFDKFNKGGASNLSVSDGGGSYSNGSWTGSAKSVTFSANSQIRFGSLTIN